MPQQQSFADYALLTNGTNDIDDATLTIPVAATTNFPDTTVGPFVCIINRGKDDAEKILVSSYTGSQLNVAAGGRGYPISVASAHDNGFTVEHCIDGAFLEDLSAQRWCLTTEGDMVVLGSDGVTWERLAVGTAGQIIASDGTNPLWVTNPLNTLLSGTGDMVYASSANTPDRLAVGTDGQVLAIESGAPTWIDDSTSPGLAAEVARAEAAEAALTTDFDDLGTALSTVSTTASTALTTAQTALTLLVPADVSVDGTIDLNQLFEVTGAHTTSLPSPATIGGILGITQVDDAASTIESATNGGVIIGPGIPASATSIPLAKAGACIVLVSDGANWNVVAGQQDTGWVTVTSLGYSLGVSDGTPQPCYRLRGNEVTFRGQVLMNTVLFGTGSNPAWTMPTGHRPTSVRDLSGWVNGGSTMALAAMGSGGAMTFIGSQIGNGNSIDLSGIRYPVD